MYLNASIPRLECLVREEFLYNLQQPPGQFVEATVIGVSSIAGRALGFHALLDNGAMLWRLPIHALAHLTTAPPMDLRTLELWDCFSYDVAVTRFDYLAESRMAVFLPDGKTYPGSYVVTVDWCGNPDSEDPGPGGHKCAHLVALDNGCYAAQPNNRCCFAEPSKVRPFVDEGEKPDYVTNTHRWKCEDGSWITSDDDRVFYGVEARGGE